MHGKIETYIHEKLKDGKLHFTLLDPDSADEDTIRSVVDASVAAGTDGFLVGGSTDAFGSRLDATVAEIKLHTSLPVILFPGCSAAVSPHADAILFMSILNSRNPYFITKSQALAAFTVKKAGIEPIPMAYLVVEPGMTVGFIGEADALPRQKPAIAAAYALAGQLMGMRLVYLEAGSGANAPVPARMIGAVRQSIDVPLIVGGGIRTPAQAQEAVAAGADIVITGTIAEQDTQKLEEIIKAIKG